MRMIQANFKLTILFHRRFFNKVTTIRDPMTANYGHKLMALHTRGELKMKILLHIKTFMF